MISHDKRTFRAVTGARDLDPDNRYEVWVRMAGVGPMRD
jgi:hypothetical protein